MFITISIDDFVKRHVKSNPDEKTADVRAAVEEAVERKRNGAKCCSCGQPIWAIGYAITGDELCFTCTTGESDNSEDYEIESVCY